MLIDTHCHIFSEHYNSVEKIINDAYNKHIKILIINGYDKTTNKMAIDLANKYEYVYATIGYNPGNAKNFNDEDLITLDQQLNNKKVVAVGEIGLDYYWYKDLKDEQQKLFIDQIKLANKHHKPVIVHCREAIDDVYNILKQYHTKDIGGIMHCFNASYEIANKFINLGLKIGVGGIVTFKNTNLGEVIKKIPLEYIVLETDSPYLAPEPHRGKKNEPQYLNLIAQKIANLKDIDIDKVTTQTGHNAIQLFDLNI